MKGSVEGWVVGDLGGEKQKGREEEILAQKVHSRCPQARVQLLVTDGVLNACDTYTTEHMYSILCIYT